MRGRGRRRTWASGVRRSRFRGINGSERCRTRHNADTSACGSGAASRRATSSPPPAAADGSITRRVARPSSPGPSPRRRWRPVRADAGAVRSLGPPWCGIVIVIFLADEDGERKSDLNAFGNGLSRYYII